MSDGTERWLPVVGYQGAYEVSDQGRVRSLDHLVTCRAQGRRLAAGRILRAVTDDQGRYCVSLGRGHRVRVASLVLTAFVAPRPPGHECCHGDGDLSNNSLGNLRWDTHSANMHDKVRHGRCAKRNRTHCPRGHILAVPNLVASTARLGHRSCLACARTRAHQQRARRAGELFDFQPESDAKYADIMGAECHSPTAQFSAT